MTSVEQEMPEYSPFQKNKIQKEYEFIVFNIWIREVVAFCLVISGVISHNRLYERLQD